MDLSLWSLTHCLASAICSRGVIPQQAGAVVCCSFAIWPGKGIFSNAVHRLFGSRCICTTEVKDMGKLPCGERSYMLSCGHGKVKMSECPSEKLQLTEDIVGQADRSRARYESTKRFVINV